MRRIFRQCFITSPQSTVTDRRRRGATWQPLSDWHQLAAQQTQTQSQSPRLWLVLFYFCFMQLQTAWAHGIKPLCFYLSHRCFEKRKLFHCIVHCSTWQQLSILQHTTKIYSNNRIILIKFDGLEWLLRRVFATTWSVHRFRSTVKPKWNGSNDLATPTKVDLHINWITMDCRRPIYMRKLHTAVNANVGASEVLNESTVSWH